MLKGIENIGEDVFKTVTDGFFDKQERMQRDASYEQEKTAKSKETGVMKVAVGNFSKGVSSQIQGSGRRSRYGEDKTKTGSSVQGRRRYYPEEDNAPELDMSEPELG